MSVHAMPIFITGQPQYVIAGDSTSLYASRNNDIDIGNGCHYINILVYHCFSELRHHWPDALLPLHFILA